MKKLLVGVLATLLVLAGVSPAAARKAPTTVDTSGVHLKYWLADGATPTSNHFTTGQSADTSKRGASILLDSSATAATDAIQAVSFENWWAMPLAAVSQLKISTQEPFSGGAPRISILVADATGAPLGDAYNLFLDPTYCNSSNANGWRMSNWRADPDCTIWDGEGNSYTGTPAVLDPITSAVITPAVPAWDVMTASTKYLGTTVYYAYVVQDQPQANRIDRITLDSLLFTS